MSLCIKRLFNNNQVNISLIDKLDLYLIRRFISAIIVKKYFHKYVKNETNLRYGWLYEQILLVSIC